MERRPPPPPPPSDPFQPPGNWEREENKSIYEKCVEKGKARFFAQPKPVDDTKEALFNSQYVTENITHDDSPTGQALVTRWVNAQEEDEYYKNTALPDQGRFLSWQVKRREGEPLHNSDITFFQYKQAARESNVPLAPLRSLEIQQARSNSVIQVRDWIRFGEQKEEARRWTPDSEEFFAYEGTENVSSADFLCSDYGQQLGIGGIAAIESTANDDLIVTFTPIAATSLQTPETIQAPLAETQQENVGTTSELGEELLPF